MASGLSSRPGREQSNTRTVPSQWPDTAIRSSRRIEMLLVPAVINIKSSCEIEELLYAVSPGLEKVKEVAETTVDSGISDSGASTEPFVEPTRAVSAITGSWAGRIGPSGEGMTVDVCCCRIKRDACSLSSADPVSTYGLAVDHFMLMANTG